MEAFLARLSSYLADLVKAMKPGDETVVFAHGGVNQDVARLLKSKFIVTVPCFQTKPTRNTKTRNY